MYPWRLTHFLCALLSQTDSEGHDSCSCSHTACQGDGMIFSEVITAVGEPNITQEAPSLSGCNKGLSRAPADGSVGQRLKAVINCKWCSMNIKYDSF